MISAHYGMSDVFDNLVISLCKFTTLLAATDVSKLCVISGLLLPQYLIFYLCFYCKD